LNSPPENKEDDGPRKLLAFAFFATFCSGFSDQQILQKIAKVAKLSTGTLLSRTSLSLLPSV
jgi:hypothetical protein